MNRRTQYVPDFVDQLLICVDCGGKFVFAVEEQKVYQAKGFGIIPRRCLACRSRRRSWRATIPRGSPGGEH
jgi:hypothetical protein